MTRKLENRQIELLLILKEAEDFLPVHVIAEKMGVSTKTVYRDIEKIVKNVKEVKLLKKQGSGIKILFSNFLIEKVPQKQLVKYSLEERRVNILYYLLINSKKYTSIEELSEMNFVGKSSIVNDLNYLEDRLSNENIKLKKTRLGTKIIGDEKNIRKYIMNLIRDYSFIEDGSKEEYYSDRIEKNTLIELSSKFDFKKIELVERIISKHEKNLPYTIGDLYYINLVVHLLIAIERINSENYLENNEFPNITDKKFYYEAESIAADIENDFFISLPPNEIYYIYQYLVSMGVGNLNNDVDFEVKEELENIVNEFLKAVSNTNNKVNENRDNIYYLFILHIRALMRRLKYGINIKNPLLNKIKEDYSKQFSDVSVLARKILSEKISEDEIAYLTVYTESILKLNNLKTKVVLVCNSGFGTSLFLKKRIEDKLKNIEVVDVVSTKDIKFYDLSKISFIISTVKLESKQDAVFVNVMLNDEDIQNINRKVYGNGNEV